MSKTIPQLSTVPGGVTAANLFFEVARQITAGNFNGESEKISADALFALLAGTSLTVNIIQRLNPTGVAYNPATTYTLYDYLDVAYQDGHYAYINPAPSAGHLPTDSAYWLLISSDGADGAAGASGLTQAQADARYPLKTDPDPYPTYLTQAEAAALFSPLGGDAQGGLRYALSLATTSPPSSGQVRFNNAAIASVTQIFIHESDRNSAAQSEILDAIALGTRLQVALESNEEIYAWFRVSGAVVDNGSDRAIPVAFISSAGVFAAEEVTLNFLQIQGASSSGGATGIKYIYSDADGAGIISAADLTTDTTLTIDATDAQGKSATDVLNRLKNAAIFDLRKDANNWVRYLATADFTSGSVAVTVQQFLGAIDFDDTVYLSIASDAPSTGSAGLIPTSLVAFGDSITVGTGATVIENSYARKIASNTGWTLTNKAVGSTEAGDSTDLIYFETITKLSQSILAFGANDISQKRESVAGQSTFADAIKAQSAWLAIPKDQKLEAQSSNITYAGAWSNSPNYGGNLSKTSSAVGASASFTVSGNTVIIAYTRLSANTANFLIVIDGAAPISVSGANAAATALGRAHTPAIAIVENLTDTWHDVVVSLSSGTFHLDWAAGVSDATPGYAGSNVFLSNCIRLGAASFNPQPTFNIDAVTGIYNQLVRDAAKKLSDIGLRVFLVNVNARFLASDRAADGQHPNDDGHLAIANTFIDKIRSIPGLLLRGSGSTPPTPSTPILKDTFTAANGTAILGRTPDIGNAWYAFLAGSNGSIQNNAATGGASPGVYAASNVGTGTYTYKADFTCGAASASDDVQFFVRCGAVNTAVGILFQLRNNRLIIANATGTDYPTISDEAFTTPTSGSVTITVNPTSISININTGAYQKTIANALYANNAAVGFGVNGSGYSIDNILVSV